MKMIPGFYFLAFLSLFVAGCGTSPQHDTAKPEVGEPASATPAQPAVEQDTVQRLLEAASSSSPREALALRLDAAQELLRRGETSAAAKLLERLNAKTMNSTSWVRFSVLAARVEIASGQAETALLRLANPAIQAEIVDLPVALQIDLALTRARALERQSLFIYAARERALTQPWISEIADRNENAHALLRALNAVSMATLEQQRDAAQSDDWRGWVELALLQRDLRHPAAEQLALLEDWQRQFAPIPSLDSASQMVGEIRQRIRPVKRTAVLLPLSGKLAASGQAVLEGYLADYYLQMQLDDAAATVAVIDTASRGFAEAYKNAIADGAEVVIGPLMKEDLQLFGAGLQPLVPTLALNFADATSRESPLLYQFGLDNIAEVEQLVHAAVDMQYRSAIVLSDSSPWSQRNVAAFREKWQTQGGRIIAQLTLEDLNEYRRLLEERLLVDLSNERARDLMRVVGTHLQFEPRRRHDIDLVAMFADPSGGRSMRPMLSFLYAGDLPVWSSSQLHSARPEAERDRDLEGVRFLDMPWFSAAESQLRDSSATAASAGALGRLMALGADACRLQSRLSLLEWSGGGRLSGATGALQLGKDHRINRIADWFVFTDGIATPEQARPAAQTRFRKNPASMEGEPQWPTEDGETAPAAGKQPKTTL